MDNSTAPVSYTTSLNAIALPIFSAFAIAVNYVPLLSLVRVKNIAAVTVVIATAVTNFMTFTNATIWPNDNQAQWFSGVGLCDLEVSFRTPLYTVLATSTCCITKDLARAIDVDNPRLHETRAMRRRKIILDILFCFALPVIQLGLHYVVQTNRYAIIAIYGCIDILDTSWPRVVLMSIWPLVFAIINCYYAVLVISRLRKHHGRLSTTLSSTGSGLDAKKFLKLFFLTCCLLVIYLPIIAYFFYLNLPNAFLPYSWSRIHNPESWNPVIYFTTADYPNIQYDGWVGVANSILICLWYGWSNEAIDKYRGFLAKCGFSKIWPSLLEPRQPARRGSTSRGSWASHFDVVSKAIHYLDGTRKQSLATSFGGPGSDGAQSRKGSVTHHEHMVLTDIRSNSSATTSDLPDQITPIPSFTYLVAKASAPEMRRPEPVTRGPLLPRNFFSSFRTHFNLPLHKFNTTDHADIQHASQQLNIQGNSAYPLGHEPRIPSQFPDSFPSHTSNTISTNIWSGPASASSPDLVEDINVDPKRGARALHRERRDVEKAKEKRDSRENMSRVVADSVRVELGLPIQGCVQGHAAVVEVKRELVRTEEPAFYSPPR